MPLTPASHQEEDILMKSAHLIEGPGHGFWVVLKLKKFDWHIHESASQVTIVKQLMNSEMWSGCSSENARGRGYALQGCVFN